MEKELTFGEKAVGITFNVGQDSTVHSIKQAFAGIIDTLNNTRLNTDSPEIKRLMSVAITEAQGAQMWAVKGITWKD